MNNASAIASDDRAPDISPGSPGRKRAVGLQGHVRTMRKYRAPILAFTAAVTSLAVAYVMLATPVYRATATLLIEERKADVAPAEGTDADADGYHRTQVELLRSRSLAERVIDDLDLWRDPLLSAGPRRVRADAPAIAADAPAWRRALASAERFIAGERGDETTTASDAAANARTAIATEVVGPGRATDAAVDASVGAPAGSEPGVTLPFVDRSGADTVLRPLTDEDKARVVSGFLDRLRVEPLSETKLVEVGFESPDPVQAALIANATSENYITEGLESKMEMTTQATAWLVDRVDSLEEALGDSEATLAAFRESAGLAGPEYGVGRSNGRTPLRQQLQLTELEREVETNRNLYKTFFERLTETAPPDGLESTNARVAGRASAPDEPAGPNPQLIVMLAALGSLLLSGLMALLYEAMDDAVKNTGDVERGLGLPLLGVLPLIKGGRFSKRRSLPLDPVDAAERSAPFKEAVNNARTVLCLGDGRRPRRVILITSSAPGEGKSTAALNLAHSLSRMERVLLVDCDMRTPVIGVAAGYDHDAPGLTDVLMRSIKASKAIRHDAFDGAFDVLPCGLIPEQPLELLSSPRFAKLLGLLQDHYDRIVIDSASLQVASDALVLGRLSDAVVHVVKSHDTSMEFVRHAIDRLLEARVPLAGVLVAQVDFDRLATYGGDHFYPGYHDYHGHEPGIDDGGSRLALTHEELVDLHDDTDDFDLGMGRGHVPADVGRRIDGAGAVTSAGAGAGVRGARRITSRKVVPSLHESRSGTGQQANARLRALVQSHGRASDRTEIRTEDGAGAGMPYDPFAYDPFAYDPDVDDDDDDTALPAPGFDAPRTSGAGAHPEALQGSHARSGDIGTSAPTARRRRFVDFDPKHDLKLR